MGLGPYKSTGAPVNGWKNGVAEPGAFAVDESNPDPGANTYRNIGTKAATVWAPGVSGAAVGGSWYSNATTLAANTQHGFTFDPAPDPSDGGYFVEHFNHAITFDEHYPVVPVAARYRVSLAAFFDGPSAPGAATVYATVNATGTLHGVLTGFAAGDGATIGYGAELFSREVELAAGTRLTPLVTHTYAGDPPVMYVLFTIQYVGPAVSL